MPKTIARDLRLPIHPQSATQPKASKRYEKLIGIMLSLAGPCFFGFHSPAMKVTINGESRGIDGPLSVAELLAELGLGGKPVVVELNREPVLPADHGTTTVEDGARVEIVTLAAGG